MKIIFLTRKPVPEKFCKTLQEAKEIVKKFVSGKRVSVCMGADVFDDDNKFVARITYNCRIWDSQDWNTANEILVENEQSNGL